MQRMERATYITIGQGAIGFVIDHVNKGIQTKVPKLIRLTVDLERWKRLCNTFSVA